MNESVNEEPQFLEKLFMSPQFWSCLFWFPRQSSSASLSLFLLCLLSSSPGYQREQVVQGQGGATTEGG